MPDWIVKPAGRISEPEYAQPGAMRRALNCVLREPQRLDPVPIDAELVTSEGGPPVLVTPRPSGADGLYADPDGDYYRCSDSADVECYPLGSMPGVDPLAPLGLSAPAGYAAADTPAFRRGIYVAGERGVYRWEAGETVASPTVAVSPTPLNAVLEVGPDWLPVDHRVAYRMVSVYETPGGFVYRSPPSSRLDFINSTAARGVRLYFVPPRSWGGQNVRERVELYRTRTFPESVPPPEEFYRVESGVFSDGRIVDETPDSLLGAPLYTNGAPSSANFPPPSFFEATEFKGHAFLADVAGPSVVEVVVRSDVGGVFATGSATTTAGGDVVFPGDVTSGLVAGMVVVIVHSGAKANRVHVGRVASATFGAGSTTVEVSDYYGSASPWFSEGADTLNAAYIFHSVWLQYGTSTSAGVPKSPVFPPICGLHPGLAWDASTDLEAGLSIYAIPLEQTREGDLNVFATANSAPAFTADYAGLRIFTSRPVDTSASRGGVVFSKFQEPNHFPLTGSLTVGDGDAPITGMLTIRDSIIACKTDGVYRISGTPTPQGGLGTLRVDPIDPSVRVLGAMVEMDGVAYALSDRGMVAISSSGVRNITDGVVGDWFRSPLAWRLTVRGIQSDMFVMPDASNASIVSGAVDALTDVIPEPFKASAHAPYTVSAASSLVRPGLLANGGLEYLPGPPAYRSLRNTVDDFGVGAGSMTVYVVARWDGDVEPGIATSVGGTSGGLAYLLRQNTAPAGELQFVAAPASARNDGATPLGAAVVVACVRDVAASDVRIYTNGVFTGPEEFYGALALGLGYRLGGDGAIPSADFHGVIWESMLCLAAHTPAEVAAVSARLMTSWALRGVVFS